MPKLRQVAFTCILLTCCGVPVWSQSANATLSGTIRDPSGASIPKATVTAIHTATGQSRQAATGDTGEYTIPDLPIGEYRVTVAAAGFKSTIVPSVTLQVNQAGPVKSGFRNWRCVRASQCFRAIAPAFHPILLRRPSG